MFIKGNKEEIQKDFSETQQGQKVRHKDSKDSWWLCEFMRGSCKKKKARRAYITAQCFL